MIKNFSEWIFENKFPHQISSEQYWKKIIDSLPNFSQRQFAHKILDTIVKKQGGKASDRQMEILRRAQRGDSSPYPTRN